MTGANKLLNKDNSKTERLLDELHTQLKKEFPAHHYNHADVWMAYHSLWNHANWLGNFKRP